MWVHVTRYKWRDTLLSAIGARESSGRYHRKGMAPALYFAQSPIIALAEVGLLVGAGNGFRSYPQPPQIIVNTEITIPKGILDLTIEGNRAALSTQLQELTGSWIIEENCATQRLGQVAYDTGRIVAIKFPSRTTEERIEPNLVVFIDRLNAHDGASLVPYDPEKELPEPNQRDLRGE